MKYLILLPMLLPCLGFAQGEWPSKNAYLEAAYQTLNAVDWGQTRYIAQHPEAFHEIDSAWATGEHPSVETTDRYMVASAVIHYGITRALLYFELPSWCTAFQVISVGDKLRVTFGNAAIGIKVSF